MHAQEGRSDGPRADSLLVDGHAVTDHPIEPPQVRDDDEGSLATFLAITDEIVLPAVAALNEARSLLVALHPAAALGAAPSQRWRQLLRQLSAAPSPTTGCVPATRRRLAVATAFLVAEAITLDALAEDLPDDEEHAAILAHLSSAAAGARRAGAELRAARRRLDAQAELVDLSAARSETGRILPFGERVPPAWPSLPAARCRRRADRGRLAAATLAGAALVILDLVLLWRPLFALLGWNAAGGFLPCWSGWGAAVLLAVGQAVNVLASARRYYAALGQSETGRRYTAAGPPDVDDAEDRELAAARGRRAIVTAARLVGVLGAARTVLVLLAVGSSAPVSVIGAAAVGVLLPLMVVGLVCFARPRVDGHARALVTLEMRCVLRMVLERRDAQLWREIALVSQQEPHQVRPAGGGASPSRPAPELGAASWPRVEWLRWVLLAAALVPILIVGARILDLGTPPTVMSAADTARRRGVDAPDVRASVLLTTYGLALRDDAATGFLPESAQLRDPVAARRVLIPVAAILTDIDPHRTVMLSGTTSRIGTREDQIALSLRRAEAIRLILVSLGVPADHIEVRGLGSDFPEYLPDISTDGSPLPGPAQANRTVRITLT